MEPARFINLLLHFLDLKTKPEPGLSDVQETALGIHGFHYKTRLQKEFLPSFFGVSCCNLSFVADCSTKYPSQFSLNHIPILLG